MSCPGWFLARRVASARPRGGRTSTSTIRLRGLPFVCMMEVVRLQIGCVAYFRRERRGYVWEICICMLFC